MLTDDPQFHPFTPILDRILVRKIEEKAPEDGFETPERYRQHSNWGEVVAVGQGVVLGQQWVPMEQFLSIGDRVKYGEYSAEAFDLNDLSLVIIRLQDVRGIRRKIS